MSGGFTVVKQHYFRRLFTCSVKQDLSHNNELCTGRLSTGRSMVARHTSITVSDKEFDLGSTSVK